MPMYIASRNKTITDDNYLPLGSDTFDNECSANRTTDGILDS